MRVCACVFEEESNFFHSEGARLAGRVKFSGVSEGFQSEVWLRASVQRATVLWAQCLVDARGQRRMVRLLWDDREANAKITSMTSSQSSRGRHRVRLLEAPDRKMGCGSHRLTEIKEEKVRKTMFSRVTACVVTFGCRAQNSVVSQGLFDNEQIHWRVLQQTVFGIPMRENHYKMFSASHWTIAVKSEGEYTDARAVLKQDEVQAGASTITKSLLKDKKKKKHPSLFTRLGLEMTRFGNVFCVRPVCPYLLSLFLSHCSG